MILVDTSLWVDHINAGDYRLVQALEEHQVLMHPFVVGELACGNLKQRNLILAWLRALPCPPVASESEILRFIESRSLMGRGIGYVDVHLLASAQLADDALLWTRDARLAEAARSLGLLYEG